MGAMQNCFEISFMILEQTPYTVALRPLPWFSEFGMWHKSFASGSGSRRSGLSADRLTPQMQERNLKPTRFEGLEDLRNFQYACAHKLG